MIGHTLAGVVSHDTNEPERAVVDFGRVLALDPELKQMPLRPRSMFWAEFGHDLLVTGRVAEAQQYIHRGLREGDNAQLADLLGQSYYQQGEFDDAERCWRLATEWDPGRADTWWRIGRLALQRGQPREAVEPLRRAASLAPETIGPVYSLSLAYRRLGRREESDRFLERVDRLRSKSARPQGVTGTTPGPPS